MDSAVLRWATAIKTEFDWKCGSNMDTRASKNEIACGQNKNVDLLV